MTNATVTNAAREVEYEDLIETVRELKDSDRADTAGGVATIVIAEELDIARSTAVRYLRRLLERGALETTTGIGPHGPRRTFVIPEEDTDGD